MVVGRLGRDALAGLSLVFPFVMLTQTMAAGGIGSAVGAAVARSQSSGDGRLAQSLALHGMLIAAAIGLCSTVLVAVFGRSLFVAMGATDAVLASAVSYGTTIFLGAVAPWLFNVTASIVRGSGDMRTPAFAMAVSAALYIALCPILTLGVLAIPGLGITGTALAFVISYAAGTIVLVGVLFSPRGVFQLRLRGFSLDPAVCKNIVRVGALGATNAFLSNVTALITTGFVGHLGPVALAGYGLGSRLEYLVIPFAFAVGTANVTFVAANLGAGNTERAKRAAWVGAFVAATPTAILAFVVAASPTVWIGSFSDDPEVLRAGTTYLRTVAPFYGFFALGLVLYFARLAAGRPGVAVLASVARLAVVFLGLYFAPASLQAASVVIAFAFLSYGALVTMTTRLGSWQTGPA